MNKNLYACASDCVLEYIIMKHNMIKWDKFRPLINTIYGVQLKNYGL